MVNLLSLAACVAGLVNAVELQASIGKLDDFDVEATSFVLRDLESHKRQRLPVVADGSIEFHNLEPKHKYLLSMDSDTLELPWSYVIQTPAEEIPLDGSDISAVEWDIRKVLDGQPLNMVGARVDHPIDISGYKRTDLVEERPQFGLFKFFLQPSVMLSIGALALVTYLPSLLSNLDPEVLEELQKNQIGAKSDE